MNKNSSVKFSYTKENTAIRKVHIILTPKLFFPAYSFLFVGLLKYSTACYTKEINSDNSVRIH